MSIFTKRHYEAIASMMQTARAPLDAHPDAHVQWQELVWELATTFARDNPLFDRARFMQACQPGANVKARTKEKVS